MVATATSPSDTSNTVPPRGRDIATAVSDDAARLRLTLRSLRRQLVRQLRPLAFDNGSHFIRDVVDELELQHVLVEALEVRRAISRHCCARGRYCSALL